MRQDNDNIGAGPPVLHNAEQRLIDATEIVAYRRLQLQNAELQPQLQQPRLHQLHQLLQRYNACIQRLLNNNTSYDNYVSKIKT